MIGKEIRGIHHLFRLVENKRIYYACCQFNLIYVFCNLYRVGDKIFFFNNVVGDNTRKYSFDDCRNDDDALKKIYELARFSDYVYAIDKNDDISMNELGFSSILLLNEGFKAEYDRFCAENKKQAENIEKKYCSMHSDLAYSVYCLSNGSKNYFFWAIIEIYHYRVPVGVIKELLIWAENYSQLIKNLSMGTITAYKSMDSIWALRNEMRSLRENKRINDVINSFNTKQKKVLKDRSLSVRDRETLSKFGKISNIKQKNFIKKMSTVENGDEIIKQMAYLVNVPFVWDKTSLIDYITYTDAIHAEIVMENGPIVLVKVNDYDAVKYLGKNTNWCISKNKTYWNQYVGTHNENIQYMIFDFSKPEDDVMSIIGFTSSSNDGITHAHDFFNHDLIRRGEDDGVFTNQFLESFLEHMILQENNIMNILKKDGIDLNKIISYRALPFAWTKKDFFQYLHKNFIEDNIEILSDNDNKIAISIRNSENSLRGLFGKKYSQMIGRGFRNNEHIMFLDFSKSSDDFTKLLFGVVYNINDTYETYVPTMYDEHVNMVDTDFDWICQEYDLPYDVICRTNNIRFRFERYVSTFAIPLIKELLNDNKDVIDKYMTQNRCRNVVYNQITNSLLNYNSFTLIKTFYENGYTLEGLFGLKRFEEFLYKVLSKMLSLKHDNFSRLTNISEGQLEAYNNDQIDDMRACRYIGLALSLFEIFKHEHNNALVMFLFNYDFLRKSSLINHLISIIIDTEDFKEHNSNINLLIQYIMNNNIKEAQKILIDKAKNNQVVQLALNQV